MSGPGPAGGNPFEGLFGELAKLLSSQGPVNLQVARQLAQWLAVEGQPEPNPEPLERIRYEEVARVADLHVAAATGLSTSVTGGVLMVRPVGRGEWAGRTLDAYQPLLEGLAAGLTGGLEGQEAAEPDAATELLGGLGEVMGPLLLGIQAGSLVGHLARWSLGQYDLPVPRPPADEVVVVPANVNAFAADWSLPADDVRLWVCLEEITRHAVLGLPHVRQRLEDLLGRYVRGFETDPSALEAKLSDLDPTDPGSFERVLGDPSQLLGAIQTPAQLEVLARVQALVAALEGYVAHVMDSVGGRLVSSSAALAEAMRRRRADQGEGGRLVGRLFGIDLGQDEQDRGAAFVRGILERAGEEGLGRLWRSERELPTPAEIDAPGLWLERIDLPE